MDIQSNTVSHILIVTYLRCKHDHIMHVTAKSSIKQIEFALSYEYYHMHEYNIMQGQTNFNLISKTSSYSKF